MPPRRKAPTPDSPEANYVDPQEKRKPTSRRKTQSSGAGGEVHEEVSAALVDEFGHGGGLMDQHEQGADGETKQGEGRGITHMAIAAIAAILCLWLAFQLGFQAGGSAGYDKAMAYRWGPRRPA